MRNTALHVWTDDSFIRPYPLVTFTPVWTQGRLWEPKFGDRHALLLFNRKMPKKVSFPRAYRGFRASGAKEEAEFGEGRAFLRWLQKHELSIEWKEKDFQPHPYFQCSEAPKNDPKDEMAKDHSFAIKPVAVEGRKIKLYVQDSDMITVLALPYGHETDFIDLVMKYVAQRFEWEKWRAPAPSFLDWIISRGTRPIFQKGQLGFYPIL